MKKAISLLLMAALCLSLAACGGTGNESHDYILYLLEQGDYDMAIYVIEGLRDGRAAASQQTAGGVEQVVDTAQDPRRQHFEQPPEFNGTDWIFDMFLENLLEENISLEALIITDYLDMSENGRTEFVGQDLERIGLGNVTLAPLEIFYWNDAHPAVTHFNQRAYQFIFRDGGGEQVEITYFYHMEDMMPGEDSGSGEQVSGDWYFPITLENTGSTSWELTAMDITDLKDGVPLGTYIFEGEDLDRIGLGGFVMNPGQITQWSDAHPAVSDWNGREYRFHFLDGNGKTQTLSFLFENLQEQNRTADYSQDQGKDLKTLRHDAGFQQEVYPGVYWVPAVSLGESRYSNMSVFQMLSAPPEEKQEAISTLYEALQLYQVGNFTASDDNVRIGENGINWEHHKPGYHAVRTNTGCCATDSNWLRYILDGDYQEVGFLATSQRDGSGHVYNYILQDGWYYFVDLTHYRASGSIIDTAVEDGAMSSYHSTDFILGNIHKTRSVQAYVDYVQEMFNDPPGLMLLYTAENVLAVEGTSGGIGMQIIYEEAGGLEIQVVFDDPTDTLEFVRAKSPENLPDWSKLPDGSFS